MASLIPGYEYDIFISYRQKDNKHDGWVTEFVDNLKGELESTFKEEISVYFDINPHDGLLETHDVDASLEEKLKCLICIPIISRTYCDPKSFAWEHEFKAFIKNASHDQFGLKVKLPNGNYANRVLPVRIHNLDNADIKLFESTIGGVLRSIDFVYKETGVNRQLRAKDDDIIKSPGQILYRDQINKVALAVKDIVESMKSHVTYDNVKEKEIHDKEKVKRKEILHEEPVLIERGETIEKLLSDEVKPEKEEKFKRSPIKVKILVPGILVILAILVAAFLFINHRTKVKWAVEKALPKIYEFADAGKYTDAFVLAKQAEKYIPDDPKLKKLWPDFSNSINSFSDPPGAMVYRRDYNAIDTNWIFVGETPLNNVRIPYSYSMIKLLKDGFQTVYDATNSSVLRHRFYILDKIGSLPENMVHIPSIKISFPRPSPADSNSVDLKDYLIDKFEVTNKKYKAFVDSGGYLKKQYWNHPFEKEGKTLTWEEAMSVFVDRTGRHGPSTWEGGDYPKGKDNYPVGGISWYEAAAYAEFAGKSLPTVYHWRRAAGFDLFTYIPRELLGIDLNWYNSFVEQKSNLEGQNPAPVGTYQGMTGYGTLDMAGNVREWCWNEAIPSKQRYILGGGWNDPAYMTTDLYVQPPFDRSQTNGFRCVSFLHADENLAILKSSIIQPVPRDFMSEKPVSDQQFEIFKRMFAYDKTNLNSVVESEEKSEEDWIKQKITFDAAYNNERVMAYLFLPTKSKPPYQIVVYFPGSNALDVLSSETLQMYIIDFVIKNGRALIYPVYKGTYERQYGSRANSDIIYREHVKQWYWDLARSIDYLESRTDIDTGKLAYFGFSWGGRLGPLITVLENRFKVSILYVAGFGDKPLPEVDPFNYVHRVKIPTLMLNGKFDATFPYETSQKPLFELLGTSPENKRIFTYESGHFVPRDELIKETLNWLDKYLGPVKY
jgi:formylglycine-generating enzyme required for sulfatase activity/predicted esterase